MRSVLFSLLLIALLLPETAVAARRNTPLLAFTGQVAFVSDYIFRGTSRTNGENTVQADLGLNLHLYGNFRIGLWGSGVAGATAEIRQYLQLTLPLPVVSLELGATRYRFPGASSVADDMMNMTDTAVMPVGVSPEIDELSVGVGISVASLLSIQAKYHQPQGDTNLDEAYTEVYLAIPFGFWLNYGSWESYGANTSVGYSFNFNRLTVGLVYHDANNDIGISEVDDIWLQLRDGNYDSEELVFSISARF